MITIDQLARFIVESYYDGAPDDMYTAACERERSKLIGTLGYDGHGNRTVQVQIGDEI